jgi:hypothetical protein
MATDMSAAESNDPTLQTSSQRDPLAKEGDLGASQTPESTILTGKRLAVVFVAM